MVKVDMDYADEGHEINSGYVIVPKEPIEESMLKRIAD